MLELVHQSVKSYEASLQTAQKSYLQFLSEDIGFKSLPWQETLWEQAEKIGHNLKNRYQHLVVVGIGGSSLGARAIADIFQCRNIDFLDNVDAVEFESLMARLNLETTAWAFISKSGNTIETLCALELIEQTYLLKKQEFFSKCVVISENKKSSLTDWADRHQVVRCEIPLNVGGRFSVLSPVGMLPAAFLGLNLSQFRHGAIQALQKNDLVVQVVAQTLESYKRNEWITLFWPYCSHLKYFGMWYQQLWAESLGKKINLKGEEAPRASTPMWATGATDQHSILQQVMEGARDKFIIFMRVLSSEKGQIFMKEPQFSETQNLKNKTMGQLLKAEALATQEALNQNNVQSITLAVSQLKEAEVGFLLMFFQLVVSGLGQSLGINTFDQPGVELGKIIAKAKLADAPAI